MPHTRFIAAGPPDQDGAFTLRGLPAGDYVVVAVRPIEAGQETDPARLELWRTMGRRIELVEGETRTVSLPLSR